MSIKQAVEPPIEQLSATMASLADPTRRHIVELLREKPLRAGQISKRIGRTPSATSNHLKVLMDRGLVGDQRLPTDHRARVFHLTREPFEELCSWSSQVASYWDNQLDGFKKFTEQKT